VSGYEDLDAFKACHQLTLGVHRVMETLEERDATLAAQLWAAALCASSRIARGSGFRNRRMFAACVDRTLAALSEVSFYLEVGCAMDLISKEERQELESLGGRALFYSMKLVTSLADGSTSEMGPPS
jgi:four helix bundle protein